MTVRSGVRTVHAGRSRRRVATAYMPALTPWTRPAPWTRLPNAVQIYDVGDHGDRVFFAMELVQGPSVLGTAARDRFAALSRDDDRARLRG